MNIINGDIGGTKTHLQLVTSLEGVNTVIAEHRYSSSDFSQFDQLLTQFIDHYCRDVSVQSACFGVAGPVERTRSNETASITNLPWVMDAEKLAANFGFASVRLLNDFEAVGYGIDQLNTSELVTLQSGSARPKGNQLVIGAGTGLGVAQRFFDGDHYRVAPTEGGHADFAPADELQLALTGFLLRQFGRSSVEYAVSGPGLVNLFRFMVEQHQAEQDSLCRHILEAADPAAEITANDGTSEIATHTLDLFVSCYGGQAGNFALSSMATGGVYIAGGIAPKLIDRLKNGDFIDAFNRKGKMAHLTAEMPVYVVMNPNVGLLGTQAIAIV